MSKMHYVWKCGDLAKNVSRVFKLIIAMINSKEWPFLATLTVFGSEPTWTGESLKRFRRCELYDEWFYQKKQQND